MKRTTQPHRSIDVFRQTRCPEITDTRIRRLVADVLKTHAITDAEISVALMDGPAVRRLNARYHHRRSQTDVLAFDLRDHDEAKRTLLGQIVVNVDMARRRAAGLRIDAASEIMLYVVHGCLHLLGYDDHAPEQARAMHQREDDLLAARGYGRPFAKTPPPRKGRTRTKSSLPIDSGRRNLYDAVRAKSVNRSISREQTR